MYALDISEDTPPPLATTSTLIPDELEYPCYAEVNKMKRRKQHIPERQ